MCLLSEHEETSADADLHFAVVDLHILPVPPVVLHCLLDHCRTKHYAQWQEGGPWPASEETMLFDAARRTQTCLTRCCDATLMSKLHLQVLYCHQTLRFHVQSHHR